MRILTSRFRKCEFGSEFSNVGEAGSETREDGFWDLRLWDSTQPQQCWQLAGSWHRMKRKKNTQPAGSIYGIK
jgi:hypothetical protein